jgi:hypothetical protein
MNSSKASQGDHEADALATNTRGGVHTDASGPGQVLPGEHRPNDLAGGLPKSPGGHHLSADQKMDDDTGLSNTVNRAPSVPDPSQRQEQQSNVGRRDDGTPD